MLLGTGTAQVQYQNGDDHATVTLQFRVPVERRTPNTIILAPHVGATRQVLGQTLAEALAQLPSSALLLDEYAKYWLMERAGLEQVPLILEPDRADAPHIEEAALKGG